MQNELRIKDMHEIDYNTGKDVNMLKDEEIFAKKKLQKNYLKPQILAKIKPQFQFLEIQS